VKVADTSLLTRPIKRTGNSPLRLIVKNASSPDVRFCGVKLLEKSVCCSSNAMVPFLELASVNSQHEVLLKINRLVNLPCGLGSPTFWFKDYCPTIFS
jgi:hypothetical protein